MLHAVMRWIKELRVHSWGFVTTSVVGLLALVAITGIVGLVLNERVKNVTERALEYDVQLEDVGDDLRVAVLDVRHYHRNLVFSGPSRRGIADFETAYLRLHDQIERLDGLDDFQSPNLPIGQLEALENELERKAEMYYATLRPAIDAHDRDPQAFTQASDNALVMLAEIEQTARDVENLGEQLSAGALQSVRQTNSSARVVLLAVLVGLGLVGAGLGYLVVRMVREQQAGAQQLAQALQAKNDFIADASHELRTPLTVLRGNAEVALELDRTGVHVEFLEEIVRESERMTRLIEDLLFLARSDAGSLPLETETVDVEPFLTELSERAEMLARERGAMFRAMLKGEGQIQLDPARIEQSVLILVDNAAKYSSSGEPVTLMAHMIGNELAIEVWDRGPGIPEADLPYVFERFYRVDKARARKRGGAGLGLAIAKTLIEAHGGRIEVESQLNVGTRMKIFLPVSRKASVTGTLVSQPAKGVS